MTWSKAKKIHPLSKSKLSEALKNNFFIKDKRKNSGVVWLGIDVKKPLLQRIITRILIFLRTQARALDEIVKVITDDFQDEEINTDQIHDIITDLLIDGQIREPMPTIYKSNV